MKNEFQPHRRGYVSLKRKVRTIGSFGEVEPARFSGTVQDKCRLNASDETDSMRDEAGSGAARHLFPVAAEAKTSTNAEEELNRLRGQIWHADRVAQTAAISASLAHELCQPLAAILTNAQAGLRLMSAANPNLDEIREIFADIVEDEKRAGSVVRGLRNLLRNKENEREKIDLVDTIRRAAEMLSGEMRAKRAALKLELDLESPVVADEAQIQQVILNLVMNALESMQTQPIGQRQLELTLRRDGNGEALVAVRDSGAGIPENFQEKVFEPFWTSKQEGLGMGLVISRSIIESYKGRLWFSNNPDRGATFYFTLPLSSDPSPAGTGTGPADSGFPVKVNQ